MRQCRGKRVDNGEWVYGSLIYYEPYDLHDGTHKPEPEHFYIRSQSIEWVSEPNNKRWTYKSYEVLPASVGQSTGLKDKDGTDLDWWEADILEDEDGYRFRIDYLNDVGRYGFLALSDLPIKNYYFLLYDYQPDELKVIGNVTDTPELLEQGK